MQNDGKAVIHILNGESSLALFEQSGIAGEVVVWQECLCAGPVGQGFGTDFKELRAAFIKEVYGEESYATKIAPLFETFTGENKWDKVMLWFEFDLFCQINLLFALGFLAEFAPETPIYLVCPDRFDGIEDFRGLGQLSPQQFASLLSEAKVLDSGSLAWAAKVLEAYREGNEIELLELEKEDSGDLDLSRQALNLHFQLYPSVENGLNRIEQDLLEAVVQGATDPLTVFRAWWAGDPGYGMGDLQIFDYLKGLMPHWIKQIEGKLEMTAAAKGLLAGEGNAWDADKKPYWLGGRQVVNGWDFCWSRTEKRLELKKNK